jgi:hypothetical protein
MIRFGLTTMKLILLCLVVILICPARAQDDRQTSAACGMIVHTLPESPALNSFPAGFRSQVKRALSKDIAAEAKATGADQDGSDTLPLDKALHLLKLTSSTPDKQLYVVWWYEQLICGAHGNCAIWLVEADKAGVRNLVAPGDAGNPARTIGSGWGVGTKRDLLQPYPELMVTAHGYRPPPQGGPETEVSCRRKSGKDYVASDCPVDCGRSLNNFEH